MRVKCFAQEYNLPQSRLKQRPLDLEAGELTMRPPNLHDVTYADSHTVLSPLEWTLYQGCPHLRVLRHTHDHKHLLRLGKYVTQQNLVNINMERKKNYLLSCLVCVMKTTYSHAFLTPQFALIKMLCNI